MMEFPEKDLNLLLACNGAQNWSYKKPTFYNLKSTILKKYGSFDEYDIQILKKQCFKCNGKGCVECDKGIYSVTKIALQRYLLNEYVFHIPVGRVLENGYIDLFTYSENKILKLKENHIVYRNNIQGLIVHKPVVANIHYTFALFVLFFKYDKDMFYFQLEQLSSNLYSKQKGKYRTALRKHNLMMDGLADFFGIYESAKEKYNIDDMMFEKKYVG